MDAFGGWCFRFKAVTPTYQYAARIGFGKSVSGFGCLLAGFNGNRFEKNVIGLSFGLLA